MKIPIVKTWYTETVAYWKRLTAEYVEKGEPVPLDLQATILEQIHTIVTENLDNKNKHLFDDGEAEKFLWSVGDVLADLDDSAILNSDVLSIKRKDAACYRWLYLILKYHDTNLQYDFLKHKAFPPEGGAVQTTFYFGYHGCKAGLLEDQTADIQYMEVNGSKLVIEGRLSPIVRMNDSEFGIQVGDAFYWPEYTERYAHTKTFGVTVFKRYAFKFEIPLTGQTERLRFFTCGAWGNSPISVQFDSHFSRLSNCFPHSYWHMTKHLTMYPEKTGLLIRRKHFPWLQEVKLWKDMLATKDKKVIKYIPVRMFLLSRKIWKHRPIWMFMDKIYKAGDSSEYLYRYAMQQKDGIRKYYLIDKNCPDCKRLQKDGFKPLIRWSLKHRLVFLASDMIVATNSTVYAFNDMSMAATGYIRDLMHFHTVCVQHGLSVQKIAVAQNRLRDNTRLYFCASPYEIENLSKPVYGYENTNALQLTGVPRYDGLENRDKKQIMISPTWRMQAAMQVTKNEGVARDYNPDFKETAYYKVFNSLINDPRLINAAKEYGYRIAYVLHPIVSPQVKDFDQNDYVDIIPAIGDMSYETMFCESSLLVTDYSGIQFDFAYLRKPLVYLHHKDIPQHYEEGTFHYDTMAFGEICHDNDELIDLLCDYMKNGCQMKPEYRRRADDFFAFNDRNNCQRVYNVMLDYQKNVINGIQQLQAEKPQKQKLKIGLISINMYSKGLNFACPLHTFVFQQFLLKHGIDSTVINYKPNYYDDFDLEHPYYYYEQKYNNLQHKIDLSKTEPSPHDVEKLDSYREKRDQYQDLFTEREIRYKKFQNFIDRNYKKTSICYNSDLLEILDPGFDCYICVTDVIWKKEAGDGFDRGFFLGSKSMENKWKIAYSASVGVHYPETDKEKKQFLQYVNDIDFVSVRERSLKEYIEHDSDKSVTVVLDPVLLMDKEFYENISTPPSDHNYLFLYYVMEKSEDTIRAAAEYAKLHHLKVIETTERPLKNGKCSNVCDPEVQVEFRYDIGIEEWLGYIRNADCIFTNSFHCSCMCIIFEKQFFVGSRHGDKVTNLLSTFGIKNRKLSALKKDKSLRNETIDYAAVRKKLEQNRNDSLRFILSAIHKIENQDHKKEDYSRQRIYRYPIIYNSGASTGNPSIKNHIGLKSYKTNPSGSVEYTLIENHMMNDGKSVFAENLFLRKNYQFVGWRLRIRIDKKWFWYLDNGNLIDRDVFDSMPEENQRYLFKQGDAIPHIPVNHISVAVAEAAWKDNTSIDSTNKPKEIF